jgi:hypothetical protein
VSEQKSASPDRDSVTLGARKASWITDAIAVTQFAGSGFLYNERAKEAAAQFEKTAPLSDAPLVRLEDPLLIAPGWTTLPEKFDNLVSHLLKNKENGSRAVYLKEGQAFLDKDCSQPTTVEASDKVFVAVYDDVLSPPDKTAPQLARAKDLIEAVHGSKIDVMGYSLGGVAVRKMLDDPTETADQVAFLGTSHQGARFAALASYVIKRDIGFAMKLANVNATHLPAMAWMMPVDPEDPDSSPALSELNANLPRQLAAASEMINIGSDGLGTITKPWGGTVGGDGLVSQPSLVLGEIPTVLLSGRGSKQHGNLPSDTDAFNAMAKFFDWEPASSEGTKPPVKVS